MGLPNRQIARRLFLSEKTVRNYRPNAQMTVPPR